MPVKAVWTVKYQRVPITSDLTWNHHIYTITTNASKSLVFIIPAAKNVCRITGPFMAAFWHVWRTGRFWKPLIVIRTGNIRPPALRYFSRHPCSHTTAETRQPDIHFLFGGWYSETERPNNDLDHPFFSSVSGVQPTHGKRPATEYSYSCGSWCSGGYRRNVAAVDLGFLSLTARAPAEKLHFACSRCHKKDRPKYGSRMYFFYSVSDLRPKNAHKRPKNI